MNEPRRLREVGSEDVRLLLDQGRPSRAITAPERARTASRALGRVVPASLTLLVTSKSLAVAMAVGLGAAAITLPSSVTQRLLAPLSWRQPAAPPRARPAAGGPVRTPEAPATASALPAPLPSATPASDTRPKAVAAVPPAPARSSQREAEELAQEALLLERARAALQTSPAQALALVGEHARSFPRGKLGLERELVAIDALQRSGRPEAAKARASALLRQGTSGIYEARIRRLLDKSP